MITEYSKVMNKANGHIGTIVEFDTRKVDAIHLIERTDTDSDERMEWCDAKDLVELKPDHFEPIG